MSSVGARVALPGSQALFALDMVFDGAGPVVELPGTCWRTGCVTDRQPPEPGEPLRQRVESSLAQVEHQIWLLRNVLWWYLLPLALAICGHLIVCQIREGWLSVLLMAGWVAMVMIAAAAVFYWAIPIAIRSKLEPRRQELKAMLMSLNDETPAAS